MFGPIVDVRNLKTYFFGDAGKARAVDGVSFQLRPGEALGLVGESGCGKSVTALSIMRLVQKPGRIVGGEILFQGEDLLLKNKKDIRQIRGKEIAMIFQDPLTTLNPVLKVGEQIVESIVLHHGQEILGETVPRYSPFNLSGQHRLHRLARERALEMMDEVGIPAPHQRMEEYPHQFSGGMRQRVMIAIALACHPRVLLADEPTTALDVTIQAQILDLMAHLKEKKNMSILLITHDLGVVAQFCERVMVVYAGRIVEGGDVEEILFHPLHPYTQGLLRSIPRIGDRRPIEPIYGVVPELFDLPVGCSFQTRCSRVFERCREEDPLLVEVRSGHPVSCFAVNR